MTKRPTDWFTGWPEGIRVNAIHVNALLEGIRDA